MSKVKKIQQGFKEILKQAVLRKISTDNKVQDMIKEFDSHFIPEYNWSLDYHIHQQRSGLHHSEFNIFLELLGYKLVYNKNSGSILLRPKR